MEVPILDTARLGGAYAAGILISLFPASEQEVGVLGEAARTKGSSALSHGLWVRIFKWLGDTPLVGPFCWLRVIVCSLRAVGEVRRIESRLGRY